MPLKKYKKQGPYYKAQFYQTSENKRKRAIKKSKKLEKLKQKRIKKYGDPRPIGKRRRSIKASNLAKHNKE